jgi:DNA-directed RNA polymerase subunit E'/Rpb7
MGLPDEGSRNQLAWVGQNREIVCGVICAVGERGMRSGLRAGSQLVSQERVDWTPGRGVGKG